MKIYVLHDTYSDYSLFGADHLPCYGPGTVGRVTYFVVGQTAEESKSSNAVKCLRILTYCPFTNVNTFIKSGRSLEFSERKNGVFAK